jgi:LysR family glycine cleavage system transcriptional activator
MSRLPLNTLVAFRAVAETQNLRAAAEKLHLTHSAVSQQIRVLEDRLGFALFDRRGRRVVLNRSGEALLSGVQGALARLDEGVQAARSAAEGDAQDLRVTVLPSFAHRWLLPRLSRWRERYPRVALEIDASFRTVDLAREGFHAAVREGLGPWPGLASERLFDQRKIVVGSPAAARRLEGAPLAAFAREPLLGEDVMWQDWFAAAGLAIQVRPVATFNDAGLMLQAAEQDLGIAISREMLAADALVAGRLVKLSPVSVSHPDVRPYHFVYPPHLAEWAPLAALRAWLFEEIAASQRALQAATRARDDRADRDGAPKPKAPAPRSVV